MARLFGTDGVRGIANVELTPELAFKLGRAAASYFGRETRNPKIIIGRDTRLSGTMLEAALAAGICSAGGNAHLLGVIPTPAVSYLTSKLHANAGAVISASHNPFEDNGIKFFSQTGHKLPDAVEDEIEAMVAAEHDSSKNPSGSSVGRVINEEAMDKLYIDHIISTAPTKLNGLKVVMDCSNGANSLIAPVILRTLGAHVITILTSLTALTLIMAAAVRIWRLCRPKCWKKAQTWALPTTATPTAALPLMKPADRLTATRLCLSAHWN